jgi:hypothetical protein
MRRAAELQRRAGRKHVLPSSFVGTVAFKDAFCGSNPLESYSGAIKVGVMPEILPGAGRPNNLKRLDQVCGILMSSSVSALAQN